MAIQKHNTYYDSTKPNSGIYCYDENGNHKEVLTKNDLNAISSISSINDKVTTLSSKTVSVIKSTETVTATPHTAPDGTIYYELEAAPEVSDTIIKGENGISATNQGTIWTIGLSAKYLSANALNNLSGNWQNTYSAVSSNSATWNTVTDKVNSSDFTPVKNDVETLKENSAHSTLSSKNDYIKVTNNSVNYGVEFISGDLATKTWVDTNYQEKGNYLSANLSGDWQSTYNTVNTYSGDWQKVNDKLYTSSFEEFSADVDKRLEDTSAWANDTFQPIGDYLSANALDKIKETSANWDEVSAKLDISSFSSVSSNFALKTKVQEEFEQTSAWAKDNFLSANALNNLSSNWNDTYSAVTANSSYWNSAYSAIKLSSENWNLTYDSVNNSADIWNTVVDKLDKEDFNTWSANADIIQYSGVSPISIDQHNVSIDLSDYYTKTETSGKEQLDNRFKPIENEVATLKENSAHNVVESSNEYIEVQSGTNKFTLTFTSGDLATKTWVGEQLADFGGFELSTPTGDDHHPDVENPNNKKVYLINDSTSPSPDQYREWIVTGTKPSTGWLCIGDTSVDLSNYYLKNETSSRQEITAEFTNTSAWANETFQPIGNYVTSGNYITPGSAWVLVNDDNNIQWSGLDVSELGKKYIVKSSNGSVKVGSATVGNVVTYDLSADNMPTISSEYMLSNYNSATNKYELSGAKIVGENGISAEYNSATNEWNVGLEDYNNIGFARYYTDEDTFSDNATISGFNVSVQEPNSKISLDSDHIVLQPGFFHVDTQVNVSVENDENSYYPVKIKTNPNVASITQIIDASFIHNETIDLSFDIKITEEDSPLDFIIEDFQVGGKFNISNVNIHEIVTLPSNVEIGTGNYAAGNGITISNDTISTNLGNGLEFTEDHKITVKLGEGLKFDNSQVSIDNTVSGAVESVQKLEEAISTKITTNYPPTMITDSNAPVMSGTQYSPSNGGGLYGTLFNTPITHPIYLNKTLIGIYSYTSNIKAILGVYEYQPDFDRGDGTKGKTVALCDTGIVTLEKGFNEFPVIHLNNTNETTPELKTNCMYYSTIYLSYASTAGANELQVAGARGYSPQFGTIKPALSMANINNISANIENNDATYTEDLSFNDMGFNWQYEDYPGRTTSASSTYYEANDAPRMYMQIRNIK